MTTSAMFCGHANECPTGACECPPGCYCFEHTCKGRVPMAEVEREFFGRQLVPSAEIDAGLREARKIPIIVDDETRPLLETARRAKREVESWPAWKRGETDPEEMAWREVWAEELKSRTPRRW